MMKEPKKKTAEGNGEMAALMGQMTQTMQDLQAQINDLRDKRDSDGGARRLIADNMYNTPRNRLREYSNISRSAVEPFSLAMTCAAVLDEDVLSGKLSLCQIFLENVLTFDRAVGGQLSKYAAEQAKEEAQKARESLGEEAQLGEGM